MTGHILLEGGAEFGGQMAEPDQQAILLAGGPDAKISIIPTAAAPDNNHDRAGQNGERWFRQLGATQVSSLPIIDSNSAARPEIANALRSSQLIYMLGGFPQYLNDTLSGSLSWQAVVEAYHDGAIIGGSSAGAMVLCDHYFSPRTSEVKAGLGLVAHVCVLPHHDTFGHEWVSQLKAAIPSSTLIGIDEQTGIIDDGPDGQWRVYGGGAVTLYHEDRSVSYRSGEMFSID